jgi:predicted methyltransferase
MKPFCLLVIAASYLGCSTAQAPPPNVSNADVHLTSARQVANTRGLREITVDPAVRAILDAPDRSPADRQLDERRQTDELFTFFDVHPGMRVAELAAGGGYATELFARAVGSHGVVYAQNPPAVVQQKGLGAIWEARLAKPVNANVLRVDRTFDSPLPEEAYVDAVYLVHYYHDLVSLGVNRPAMNEAVYRALMPGGVYVVMDRAPQEEGALVDLHALHRAESRNARREIERAGFTLVAEGDFLRNSRDPRDWNAAPLEESLRGAPGDRFVLKFIKR